MSENALTVSVPGALMPVLEMGQAITRYNYLKQLTSTVMVEDLHYGKVPGTDKPTLYKPGAEMLTTVFGLVPRFETIQKVEQWDGPEPMFYYWIRCSLYKDGALVGEGDGSCNSRESRYRFRWVPEDDVPPGLDKGTLRRRGGKASEFTFAVDKAETQGKYGKPPEYWQQFTDAIETGAAVKVKKATAKGAQYDAWQIDMAMYRVPNEDIFSQVNTILKMACKRALVAAVLITVNASEFFTQDMEDLIDVPATVTVINQSPAPQPEPKQNPYEQPTGDPFLNGDPGHEADLAEAKREYDDLLDDSDYAGDNRPDAVARPHWIDRVDKKGNPIRKAFWAWAGDSLGLKHAEVHEALDVESVRDFDGTMAEAKTAILKWVTEQNDEALEAIDNSGEASNRD
jgi:hypothetical protein